MYGSLTDWRAYATARGFNAPAEASDDVALAALMRASDHVMFRYVANLCPGHNETLSVVEPATYQAALLELATPGFFTKTYTPSEQKVLTEVGPIKWTVVGGAKGAHASTPTSSLIDAMFAPYLCDGDAPGFMLLAIGGGGLCG